MVLLVLWVSGLASGVIDNIPFTITMIPIVQMMLADQPLPHENVDLAMVDHLITEDGRIETRRAP